MLLPDKGDIFSEQFQAMLGPFLLQVLRCDSKCSPVVVGELRDVSMVGDCAALEAIGGR
jgi:hypothetical protein